MYLVPVPISWHRAPWNFLSDGSECPFVSWNEPLSDMPEFMLMRNSGWGEHERGHGDFFYDGA